MFVRAKKQGGRNYYYLVESYQVRGKIRQKVLRYLGKKKPTLDEQLRIIGAMAVSAKYQAWYMRRIMVNIGRLPMFRLVK